MGDEALREDDVKDTVPETAQPVGPEERKVPSPAARSRAAIEMIARHEATLRRTARRYSLGSEDAEDAYQRALEILLTKAPTDRPTDLLRWTHTVIKHEALAVRRTRERMLGGVPRRPREGGEEDWVALIPAGGDGPQERLEERERVARSREALQSLKPAELRALTLLATGHSYEEIGEITGFSRTKVNRCLAEGRERLRRLVSRSEDGSHCIEMQPLLSAFCDGELGAADERRVREHLRACGGCRATMRAYRSAPATAAALVPALPVARSLFDRIQDLIAQVQLRLSGAGSSDSALGQIATSGGTRGVGMAATAKLAAVCAGAVGGAACVATGVAPIPLDPGREAKEARIERVTPAVVHSGEPEGTATPIESPRPEPEMPRREEPQQQEPGTAAGEAETGAVEYTPSSPPQPPPPNAAPAPVPSSPSSSEAAGAAGEFGP